MNRITPISWRKFEKFLLYVGCTFKRQKGDHLVYVRSNLIRPVIVPKIKNIPVFIIRNNLRVLKVDHNIYLEIIEKL